MKEWKNNLRQMATRKQHLNTLNTALEAYLTSPYADDMEKRTETILLFKHLKKLLKKTTTGVP